VGEGTRAARRAVCQGSRDGSREKNKPHHRRGSCRRRATNPSSLADGAQLAQKEKGRFGVGAGLRGQIPDRPPILKGSVGPSKAPLAYRPTSSLPNPPGQVKRKKRVGSELGRSFEVRSSIGRRSAGDQSDRVKLRSLIVLRPPCPTPRARCLRSKSPSPLKRCQCPRCAASSGMHRRSHGTAYRPLLMLPAPSTVFALPQLASLSSQQWSPQCRQARKIEERSAMFLLIWPSIWAFLLTVKQDTVKTGNRILDTLWEALSG